MLLPLGPTARLLCVPSSWLRAEADAGHLPHLRAGSKYLFDVDTVERLLVKRARHGGQGNTEGSGAGQEVCHD